jgi:hypothetical protein
VSYVAVGLRGKDFDYVKHQATAVAEGADFRPDVDITCRYAAGPHTHQQHLDSCR